MSKKITLLLGSTAIVLMSIASLSVVPVFAQTSLNAAAGVGVTADVGAPNPTASGSTTFRARIGAGGRFAAGGFASSTARYHGMGSTTAMANMQSRAATEISARISSLQALASRINDMKYVSATEKTSLSTQIQTQITAMTTLQAKIQADTTVSELQTDLKSITGSYRIYALIVPQGRIFAEVDRVENIVTMMTTLGTKLQARIGAMAAGSEMTSLQATLSDYNAKIADAQTQATAAQTEIANLTPDQGNQTQLDANTNTLKDAQSKIKIASQDLSTARTDAGTIVKGIEASGSASATVSASSTTTQ